MTAHLHPIVDQVRLGLVNTARAQWARPGQTLFLALAWALMGGFAWLVYQQLPGEPIAAAIESASRSPWASGFLLAAAAFFLQQAALLRLRRHLVQSCWAALPIAGHRYTRTLTLLGVFQIGTVVLIADSALLAAAAKVQNPERWLSSARSLALCSLVGGGFLGLIWALRRLREPKVLADRRRTSQPLFTLPLLEYAVLPVFGHWQRSATLRRFRGAGRWWQYLLLGLAVPAGIGLPTLAGLLLLGVVLIWFGLVLTCARVTIVAAAELTIATPLRFSTFALATVWYPLLASVAAVCWGLLALAMQDAPQLFLLGWPLFVLGWCALQLAVAWHGRRRPRGLSLRLTIDVLLILAVAQAFPPLAGLLWLGLIVYHLLAARQDR